MEEELGNTIREDPQLELTPFDIEVLAVLPRVPNGLSLHELAEGLLGSRGPQALGQVTAALDRIAAALGEDNAESLIVRGGDDDFGHADVPLYGVGIDPAGSVRMSGVRCSSAACRGIREIWRK